MIYGVYSIQDVLVGYHAPMVLANDEVAIRSYTSWCQGKNDIETKDLRLFKVGTFDDASGTIIGSTPECICGGI